VIFETRDKQAKLAAFETREPLLLSAIKKLGQACYRAGALKDPAILAAYTDVVGLGAILDPETLEQETT
jgi:hypothetical protein